VAKDVHETARALAEAVIVAVVRAKDQGRAAAIVDALLAAGIRALEVTAPTPGCFEILRARAASSKAVLGVGTVLDRDTVLRAKEAGARFIGQYDSVLANPAFTFLETTKNFNADFLITYLLHPGTALYVGYTDGYDNLRRAPADGILTPGGAPTLSTGRQVFVKSSYLFRF